MDQTKVEGVAGRIRRLVDEGGLALGDPLPSTRRLALELGVSRGTVVSAYEQLDGEGWIRTSERTVARVAAAPSSAAVPAAPAPPPSPRAAAPAPDLIDLRPGVPKATALSARDRRAAWSAAASAPLRDALAEPAGVLDLRERVAAQLALVRGFAPSPDRILVCGGTSDAISLVVEALRMRLGRAPVVVVEDPGYPAGRAAAVSAGAVLHALRVDDAGLDPDLVPAEADAVLVTPAHQYPMGAVMPIDRRRRLLARAAEIGATVIEDDYDSEFRHRGSPLPALAALDVAGVVVHLGTFSKNLDPALRCSYAVLPPTGPVAEAVRAARLARGPVVADTVQLAVAHLIRSGALRRHIGRLRRDYAHKRRLILDRLPGLARLGVTAHALHGGLHVVLAWQERPASAEVVRGLERRGVRVADLAFYRVGPDAGQQGVVLGYGAATALQLDRALDALAAELRGTTPASRS